MYFWLTGGLEERLSHWVGLRVLLTAATCLTTRYKLLKKTKGELADFFWHMAVLYIFVIVLVAIWGKIKCVDNIGVLSQFTLITFITLSTGHVINVWLLKAPPLRHPPMIRTWSSAYGTFQCTAAVRRRLNVVATEYGHCCSIQSVWDLTALYSTVHISRI